MLFLSPLGRAEWALPRALRAPNPAHSAVDVPAGGLPTASSAEVGESAAVGWGVGTAMLHEASDPDTDGLG